MLDGEYPPPHPSLLACLSLTFVVIFDVRVISILGAAREQHQLYLGPVRSDRRRHLGGETQAGIVLPVVPVE